MNARMRRNWAPIVVFAYNRPIHLRRTLDALAEAEGASQSSLWIFCDGPRPGAEHSVMDVRRVANDRHWLGRFGSVVVTHSEPNLGLAQSIIAGVSKVLRSSDAVIVLEDDLLVSDDFLTFMNDNLGFFEKDRTVGSVTGFSPLAAIPQHYEHTVMRIPRHSSQGWGTWENRWKAVDWEARGAVKALGSRALRRAFVAAGSDRLDRLRRQLAGRIDSWSIRIGFDQIRKGQDCIYPTQNRVLNIGYDGTGVHSGVGQPKNEGMLDAGSVYTLTNPPMDKTLVALFHRAYSGTIAGRLARSLRVACWLRHVP